MSTPEWFQITKLVTILNKPFEGNVNNVYCSEMVRKVLKREHKLICINLVLINTSYSHAKY